MAKYKVLMIGRIWPSTDINPDTTMEREMVEKVDAELVVDNGLDEERYIELIKEADAIIPGAFDITDKILSIAKKCKIIAKAAVGYDHIDIAAATRHGVIVTNVTASDFCLEEVADQTMALILGVERRIVFLHQKVSNGKWMEGRATMKPMFDLRGQTLGLAAFGAIARAVSERARPFGFKIISTDPAASSEEARELGVELVDFDTLLRTSDIISIHVPLSKSTYHLFNEQAFSRMKDTAYLINTARGELIDQKALYKALTTGRILAAGLDVLEKEPPEADDPLLNLDNVIILPHSAGYAEGSYERARKGAAREVVTVLQGKQPKNWINRKELNR